MKDQEDIRSLQLALGLYVVIFAMKLAVYMVSGVRALLAEAHDIAMQVDALMEPLLGNGICEVHVDPQPGAPTSGG